MKNRFRFRSLTIVLVVLGLVLLAACSSDKKNEPQQPQQPPATESQSPEATKPASNFNESGFPIVNEKVTIKMAAVRGTNNPPLDEIPLYTEYEKMTNVHVDFKPLTLENHKEQKSLMFASNELPEVIMAWLTEEETISNGSNGTLIPLEDLIEKYAPNLKAIFDANPDYKKQLMTPEGHIYTLPLIDESPVAAVDSLYINKAWLDKLKLEVPQTPDELYNVLKAFKEGDPNGNGVADEIPLILEPGGILEFMPLSFGLLQQDYMSVIDGKVVPMLENPEFKNVMAFLNKLYAEGLVDQEMFTLLGPAQDAKGHTGVLGTFFRNPAKRAGPEFADQYVLLPPLEHNGKRTAKLYSPVTRGEFAITNVAKSPEIIIRWIDYFYSLEGSKMAMYGPEGMGYVDNSNGTWQQAPVPAGKTAGEFVASLTSSGGSMPYYASTEFYQSQVTENAAASEQLLKDYLPYAQMAFPRVYLTAEEQKTIAPIQVDYFNFVLQTAAGLIMDKSNFDKLDGIGETLKKMNVDTMVATYQQAYDRYQSFK